LTANAQQPQLFINELVAMPHQMLHDSRGEYDDWIEIYNAGDTAVCVAGFHLTDDLSKPTKAVIDSRFKQFTTIAPKGHLLLWLDKGTKGSPPIHVPLKLSGGGEQLGLFSPDGQLIDSVSFGPQKPNISYGRIGDGQAQWGFTKTPTPKAANPTELVTFAPKTQFDRPGGFYPNSISVAISGAAKRDTIRYTEDGTMPGRNNGKIYHTPLQIDTTTVIRAAIFGKGKRTEFPVTHTYFINDWSTLPVISLATDSLATLLRTNAGSGFKGENLVHLEFFEDGNQANFSVHAGFRLQGLAIRFYPQKSMAVRLRSEYGSETLSYPLFPQKPQLTTLHDFSIRASGNDNNRTLFRDGLMHSLVSKDMHIDYLAYRPVVVYVNGMYWGIHNIREKISQYYLTGNHTKKGKKADLLEWKTQPVQGKEDNFKQMMHYASSRDLSVPANYDTIAARVDLDNYIDYYIAETFYGNIDWPMANCKYWRPTKEGGKWRWIMFDVDLAFDLRNQRCRGHHNSIQYVLGTNNCHLPHLSHALLESTVLFRSLIKNDVFRERFVARYVDVMNTNFRADRVAAQIQLLRDSLATEMPKHIQRWSGKRGIRNMATWEKEVGDLYQFGIQRPDTMRHFLSEAFDLGTTVRLQINVHSSAGGTVQVNSIIPKGFPFVGIFFEKQKVTLIAQPAPGYRFKQWKETGESTPEKIITSPIDGAHTAVFERLK